MSRNNCTNPPPKSQSLTQKLSTRKALSHVVADYLDQAGYHNPAAHIRGCGKAIVTREYADGVHEIAGAMFCRERLCPMCQWRRSIKLFGQLSQCMDYADCRRVHRYGAPYRYIHLVLTIQNCWHEDLAATLDRLRDGFRALRHEPEWLNAVKGAYASYEITKNADPKSDWCGSWHPHMHLILAVNPSYAKSKAYVSQEAWRYAWRRCLGVGYLPDVHVKMLPPPNGEYVDGEATFLRPSTVDHEGCNGKLHEVTKYVCKSDWLSVSGYEGAADAAALQSSLRGRKLCTYYGVLRDAHRCLHLDDEDGDLVHLSPIRNDVDYVLKYYVYYVGGYVERPMQPDEYNALILHNVAADEAEHRKPRPIQYVSGSEAWEINHEPPESPSKSPHWVLPEEDFPWQDEPEQLHL